MSKKKVKKGASIPIVTINRPNGTSFLFSGNKVDEFNIKKAKINKDKFISYLQYKDVLSTSIEIPGDTPEDEILDRVTVKTFEDLMLDANLDYKISFNQSPMSDDQTRYFNVFAVNEALIEREFGSVVNQTKFLDYIAIAPFMFESLYVNNLISPTGIDCFIYFQKDDAFLVVYSEGEYLQSRSLTYNLKYIYNSFSNLSNSGVSEDNFYDILASKSYFQNDEDMDILVQVFDEMFVYINNLILSMNNLYKINIQNIYLSSDIGDISLAKDFVTDKLSLTYKDFNFISVVPSKGIQITQLDNLMYLIGNTPSLISVDDNNYSTFVRPAPLKDRLVGKLLKFALLGALLAALYPIYLYAHGYYMNYEAAQKEEEYAVKSREENRIKTAIKKLQDQIQAVTKLSGDEDEKLTFRTNLLNQIHSKKINYPMKSIAIYNVSNMINNNKVNLFCIRGSEEQLTFCVDSDHDKQVTQLIKDISDSGMYRIDTKTIKLVDEYNNTFLYESNITIGLDK